MAEFMSQHEADSRYGKKGTSNTALGLGIAGTALGLGLFNGGLGNLFGGIGSNANTANSGLCAMPSMWSICEKQNAENVALTSAIYQARIKEMEDLNAVYQAVNTRLVELEKKDAALTASLPLAMQLATVNAERYTDNKVAHAAHTQNEMNFFMQREIDKRVVGTLGLPYSSVITGIPTMPACTLDVTCPSK